MLSHLRHFFGDNIRLAYCLNSVLNVKALVGTLNQEKGEGPSRGLLRDCTTLPINRVQHYHYRCTINVLLLNLKLEMCHAYRDSGGGGNANVMATRRHVLANESLYVCVEHAVQTSGVSSYL